MCTAGAHRIASLQTSATAAGAFAAESRCYASARLFSSVARRKPAPATNQLWWGNTVELQREAPSQAHALEIRHRCLKSSSRRDAGGSLHSARRTSNLHHSPLTISSPSRTVTTMAAAAAAPTYQSPQANALQDALNDNLTIQSAVDLLASLTLTSSGSPEDNLDHLWSLILGQAVRTPASHSKLVDLLVHLSKLADATHPQKPTEPLVVHDMQVWSDLPLFGWAVRDAWNRSVPATASAAVQQRKAAEIVNLNAFAAQLLATDEPVFHELSWFALVTLREALENPAESQEARVALEAAVPAAAAWIEHLGVEIHTWDEQFPAEEGTAGPVPGKGGKLWEGEPGFAKGRWKLWQERFAALSQEESGLSAPAREKAQEAYLQMKDISDGEVV